MDGVELLCEWKKTSILDPKFLPFLLPLHKVIFWVWIVKMNFILFSKLRLLWIVFNVASRWIMLFKNGSLSIWGFEFWNWGFWLFDEYWWKFQFVMSSDVVYVLELIENGLHLFWDDLEAMRDNSIKFWNSTKFASND